MFSPEGARIEALYRGTAALAQALARDELGLDTRSASTATATGLTGRPTVASTYVSPNPPVEFGGAYGGYHAFASGSMQDAFDGFPIVGGEARMWFTGGSGVSAAAALLGGDGPVEALQPDFQYETADVSIVAAAFEVSYLYRLRRHLMAPTWFPYVGIGGDWYVGPEEIKLKVTYSTPTESGWFEGEERTWRTSVAAHFLAGAQFLVSRRAAMLLEARWTQGGNGWSSHPSLEPGSPDAMLDEIFHFLVRPTDFNFTGWEARLQLMVRI